MLRNGLLLLGFLGVLLSSSFAEDNPPLLTNADLAKYKRSDDNSSSQMQSAPQQIYDNQGYQADRADRAERNSYESWCSAGAKCRNRVFRAKDDVKEADERYRTALNEYEIYKLYKGKMGKPSDYITAQRNLENAKKRLRDADDCLSDLESEAHVKGIKPGWLRCQK